MKKISKLAPLTFFAPFFAFAQAGPASFDGIGAAIANFTIFLNERIVPFIFALAFLVFIWGMFKTFILGGSDEEKQKEGKQLMLWAIIGFVVMVSLWGIVNIFANGLGFQGQSIQAIPNLPVYNIQ